MATLDNLKKSAKRWLKALRAGDVDARARFDRAYPSGPRQPSLRDVQHALAREEGAENWLALTARVAADARGRVEADDSGASAQLLEAASRGRTAEVAALLDASPHLVDHLGTVPGHTGRRTPLHFAAAHREVVSLLLERGADPNIRDDGDNAFPLHFVAERGDLATARLLIEHGADPIGDGDLHELGVLGWATAFATTHRELAEYLLANGARHTIWSAVALGDVSAILVIVAADAGALEHRRADHTGQRRTPLHLAVVKQQRAAIETLIDLGADLEARDAAQLTPLDRAALDGEVELAELLIARGAVVDLPAAIGLRRVGDVERMLRAEPQALLAGHRFGTILVRAAERARGDVIELLLKHGAAIDAADGSETAVDGADGYTALHAAAFHGNADAVRVLLAHGANPTRRDIKYCATPAGWAAYAGHSEIRDQILAGPIDLFDAVAFDRVDRMAEIVSRDPGALARPFGDRCRGTAPRPDQWWPQPAMTPIEWARAQAKDDAVRVLADLAAILE